MRTTSTTITIKKTKAKTGKKLRGSMAPYHMRSASTHKKTISKEAKIRSFRNMDGWGANTDIPVRVQGEDMRLYAMVLPVIVSYLSSQQQRVGNVEEAACVCFTIALVALTASRPLPCSSKAQQICLFHLILGCALVLSLAVPNMLCWAPYFSCIRPIFHLLPRSFQLRILQFFRSVFDAIKGLVGLVSFAVGSLFQMFRSPFGLPIRQSNASGRLVAVGVSRNPPQSSSPVQADFNSQQVVELAAGGRLVEVGVAQSSSPAQANFNSQQEEVELRVQEMTSMDAASSGVHKP